MLVIWSAFDDGLGLSVSLPVTAGIVLVATATPFLAAPGKAKAAAAAMLRQLAMEWPIWLIFIGFELTAAFLLTIHLTPDDMNIVTMGNNDVMQYGASALRLAGMESSAGNVVGYDFNTLSRANVIGAFGLLGLASSLFGQIPVAVSTAPLVAGAALAATSVAAICRNIFRLPWILAVLAGLALLGSSTFTLVAGNYFLAQTLRTGLLLAALAEMLRVDQNETAGRTFQLASVVFLYGIVVLFVYPGLFVADTILVVVFGLGCQVFGGTERGILGRVVRGAASLASFLGAVALIAVLAFRKAADGLNYFLGLSEHAPEWPLPFFSPLNLLGAPIHWQIDFARFGVIEFGIVGVLGALALAAGWRLRGVLGGGPIALVLMAAASFAGYLLTWLHYGPSYQQWKFAALYPLILGFGIPSALLAFAWMRAPQPFGRIAVFIFGAVVAAADLVAVTASGKTMIAHGVRLSRDLYAMQAIDDLGLERGIVVDVLPFPERMLAAALIAKTPLFFTGPTYYGRQVDLAKVAPGFPVLRRASPCLKPSDRRLGAVLVLTDKSIGTVPLDVRVPFAAAGVPCYASSGLSGVEPDGRWNDGQLVALTIRVPHIPGPLAVKLEASAFVHPPKAPRQRMEVSLAGEPIDYFEVTKAQGAEYVFTVPEAARQGDLIELRFSLPDAVSPAAIKLGQDNRVLAVKFASFTVTVPPPDPHSP
ncbi:MAG TPA: hypothetical protein VFB16_10670 [Bauldia sp.]|nr:hypothetical protein [Bauldia sp.]